MIVISVLFGLLFLFVLFLIVVLTRAVFFNPRAEKEGSEISVAFDEATVTNHLAQMLRIPTVSNRNPALVDRSQFVAFQSLLEKLYPEITRQCKREFAGETGLLYLWKGKNQSGPTVLMAHYDVVPVDSTGWKKPPFSGELDSDGVLWGRGAIDTKITLCGIMEAAEQHIKNGFIPEHDIYLAFSGDEEIMGPSASAMVDLFAERGIKPSLVIDEGGAVVNNIFPGVTKPCAVIGITEKGVMDLEFTVKSQGGHSSAPPLHNPVAQLSEAICKVEKTPFPAHLTPASTLMFDTLGRHSSFAFKILFANLWCFFPVLKKICARTGGELNALVRTTCLFTILEGSPASNVMPPRARAVANLRLLSGESSDSAFNRLKTIIDNPAVEMRKISISEPASIADVSGDAWNKVASSVRQTWPSVIIAPYLMVACTDSRHYSRICNNVLRFSAMELTKEERATMHAHNERIPASKIPKTCAFFFRVIAQV